MVAGDSTVAEEAVQEAFSKLCQNWQKVSQYEEQVAWIRRVAVNQIRDHQRAVRRRAALVLRMQKEPEEVVLPKTADAQLWQAVRRLSLKQRTAVALYYVADLSVVEVAAAMGVSRGAALKHLDRARSRLRVSLEVRP